jgi:hypothetical protein
LAKHSLFFSPRRNEDSFLGRGDIPLAALKIQDTETFSLDIRDAGADPEFRGYHPNDLVLEVQIWNYSAVESNDSKFDREVGWPIRWGCGDCRYSSIAHICISYS